MYTSNAGMQKITFLIWAEEVRVEFIQAVPDPLPHAPSLLAASHLFAPSPWSEWREDKGDLR